MKLSTNRILLSFKPYYKWNTFNTEIGFSWKLLERIVLNLIINGIPSIHTKLYILRLDIAKVLNLIINGIPSILYREDQNYETAT